MAITRPSFLPHHLRRLHGIDRRVAVVAVAGLLVVPGCRWLADPDVLTRAEYEQVQERHAAEIDQRLDDMHAEIERQFQRQERRLMVLNRRLIDVTGRLAALAEDGTSSGPEPADDGAADDGAADDGAGDDGAGDDGAGDDDEDLSVAVDFLAPDETLVFGATECVVFPDQGVVLRARIDSGAETSSMHATDIEPFERDGAAWVRFDVPGGRLEPWLDGGEEFAEIPDDAAAVTTEVESKVTREVRIRQTTGEESRHVVALPIRIGPLTDTVEFTLTDRADMTVPVLLGRKVMRDIALIDVGREFVQPCPDSP